MRYEIERLNDEIYDIENIKKNIVHLDDNNIINSTVINNLNNAITAIEISIEELKSIEEGLRCQ